jgi:hypothetical protein
MNVGRLAIEENVVHGEAADLIRSGKRGNDDEQYPVSGVLEDLVAWAKPMPQSSAPLPDGSLEQPG